MTEKFAQIQIFKKQTREELRKLALALGVKRGRNKYDTIINLIDSGKFEVRLCLASKTWKA